MSWTIIIEDENRKIISKFNNEFTMNQDKMVNNNNNYKLIKYLNPYGDTIFNNLQIPDLISDLNKISILEPDNNLTAQIVEFVSQCLVNEHTYLVFYGD